MSRVTDRQAFERRMLDFGWRNFEGGMHGEPSGWYYDNTELNCRWIGWREAMLTAAPTAPQPDRLVSDREYLRLFEQAKVGSDKPSGTLRGIRACIAAYEAAAPTAPQAAAQAEPQEAFEREPSEVEQVCAEAYQVVGSLLSDLGVFETDQAEKILDNLSQQKMVHKDVLPWPSFEKPESTEQPTAQAAPVALPEPDLYRYQFDSVYGDGKVWRMENHRWNGQEPQASEGMFSESKLIAYGEARAAAALPPGEPQVSQAAGGFGKTDMRPGKDLDTKEPADKPASVNSTARDCPNCKHSDSWGIPDKSCCAMCAPTADGKGANFVPLNGPYRAAVKEAPKT